MRRSTSSPRARAWAPAAPLLALLLPAACDGPDPAVSVRLDGPCSVVWHQDRAEPCVDVTVDGAPLGGSAEPGADGVRGLFLLDTGSERSSLAPAFAARLGGRTHRLLLGRLEVAGWRPEVEAPPSAGLDGVLGADVLGQVDVDFDPFVRELRLLPPGGLQDEMAGFAAEGWSVETLPLVDASGPPCVQATEVDPPGSAPGSETGLDRDLVSRGSSLGEVASPFGRSSSDSPGWLTLRVATGRAGSGVPVLRALAARTNPGPEGSPVVALRIGDRVLDLSAAGIVGNERPWLGWDALGSRLVGWDARGGTLWLAEPPWVAGAR